MNLSLESLRCFVAAAETLNFRNASARMNLTPAALGQRIKALEEEAGATLFHRTTRKVTLSKNGQLLLPEAKSLLKKAQDLFLAMAPGETPPAHLLIGTRHELGVSWLVPARRKMLKQFPKLRVDLHFGSALELNDLVSIGKLDCAVSSHQLLGPKLSFVTLHEENYKLVGSAKVFSRTTSRAQLEGRKLVDVDRTLPLFRYFRDSKQGFSAQLFSEVVCGGTIEAIADVVLHGEGVAVLPEYYVKKLVKQGKLVELFPKRTLLSDTFKLIFREDSPHKNIICDIGCFLKEFALR